MIVHFFQQDHVSKNKIETNDLKQRRTFNGKPLFSRLLSLHVLHLENTDNLTVKADQKYDFNFNILNFNY